MAAINPVILTIVGTAVVFSALFGMYITDTRGGIDDLSKVQLRSKDQVRIDSALVVLQEPLYCSDKPSVAQEAFPGVVIFDKIAEFLGKNPLTCVIQTLEKGVIKFGAAVDMASAMGNQESEALTGAPLIWVFFTIIGIMGALAAFKIFWP